MSPTPGSWYLSRSPELDEPLELRAIEQGHLVDHNKVVQRHQRQGFRDGLVELERRVASGNLHVGELAQGLARAARQLGRGQREQDPRAMGAGASNASLDDRRLSRSGLPESHDQGVAIPGRLSSFVRLLPVGRVIGRQRPVHTLIDGVLEPQLLVVESHGLRVRRGVPRCTAVLRHGRLGFCGCALVFLSQGPVQVHVDEKLLAGHHARDVLDELRCLGRRAKVLHQFVAIHEEAVVLCGDARRVLAEAQSRCQAAILEGHAGDHLRVLQLR